MTSAFASPSAPGRDLLDLYAADEPAGVMLPLRAAVDRLGLILLLLTVGSLLVRPADLLPALSGAPIYECLVAACLLFSIRRVQQCVTPTALRRNPVVAFVLLLVPAIAASHLARGSIYDARIAAFDMAKACVFFLLVISQIDTKRRLHAILFSVVGCVSGVAVLAILQYHGWLSLAGLEVVEQRIVDPFTGEAAILRRLCGIGVFSDPNDFSLVLVVAMVVCGYGLGGRSERRRWRWLFVPLAICAYALLHTHSRGGMVAAAGGAGILVAATIGKRNTMMLRCLVAPLILLLVLGRQQPIDPEQSPDTFQTRLELWSESFDLLRADPVFGIGAGKLVEAIGQVAHNSFLHAFTEMGILGGTAFFGAFYLLMRTLWNATPVSASSTRTLTYVLALTTAYVLGMLSLSRCYTVPTQLILAIGAACVGIMSRDESVSLPAMNLRCVGRVVGAGAVFLGLTYVFLRVMLQRGGV